jgi:hypothetical protein
MELSIPSWGFLPPHEDKLSWILLLKPLCFLVGADIGSTAY